MRRNIKLVLSLFVLLCAAGCMWKSDHVKIVTALNKKLAKVHSEKSELQSQLDTRSAELKSMTEDKNRLETIKGQLETKISKLAQLRAQCLQDLKSLAAKGGKLSKRLTQAIEQIQRLQAIAKKRSDILNRLRASFKTMVDAGKLRVKMVKGLLVVQLAEKILFASGKSVLKSEGKQAIAQVASLLKDMKRRWQVAGHTDSKGSPSVNWYLSVQRARAVHKVMLKNDMPPEYISIAGFGQYDPTAPNDTPENRSLNRRTELVLLPNLQELQLASLPSPFWVCKANVLARR